MANTQSGEVSRPRPSLTQLITQLRTAVADLDAAALPDEALSLYPAAQRHFARAMRALYATSLPTAADLQQLLAACGQGAAQLLPLEWGKQHFVHQFLTQEFVAALATHLRHAPPGPLLEVGAGDGTLARHLRARDLPLIATDDGSWLDGRHAWPAGLPPDVLPLSYPAALARFQPVVVLCAWMPLGEDWTPAFRACPSVREYLLIGEGPGGCTGTPASFATPHPWQSAFLTAIADHGFTRNADRAYRTSVYSFTRPKPFASPSGKTISNAGDVGQ